MKSILRALLPLFISLVTVYATHARDNDGPGYGIRIQSYPADAADYTSILLDDGAPIDMNKKEMRLEMDIWAYPENPLGSICRIISDNGSNIDLMYSVGENYSRHPMLITGDEDITQSQPVEFGRWVHVEIAMSPSSGKVSLDYDGEVSETDYQSFKGSRSVRISVGMCRLSDYLLFDVASVAVKDVKIYRGNKEIRFWKMERHGTDVCYDEIDNAPATVENPNWIIDEAATWDKIYTCDFPYFPSIAFDPRVATFYMAYPESESLFVYHATEGATDTIKTRGGEFAANYPNQLIYISQLHRLLSYNLDEDLFSTFDPNTQRWSSHRKSTAEHAYWNNSIVYDPADTSLISFGGYGYYRFNNVLLKSYPYSDRQQSAVTLTDIHPRYSCSSVLVDSTMYIFGGRGCPSGRQEMSPTNYYDMYAVNVNTNKVKKLWGDNTSPVGKGKDFVPGENMIYDEENDCMYIWATLNGGTLLKADMSTGEFEEMSLPIGVSLKAQTLYCNLYYSAPQKSLYCVVINSDVQGASVVSIYSLGYPPVSVASLNHATAPVGSHGSGRNPIKYVLLCIAALLCGSANFLILYRSRRRRRASQPAAPAGETIIIEVNDDAAASPEESLAATDGTQMQQVADAAEPTREYYDLNRSCVRFLGGFRVFDKNGEDITPQFTPTLKQLLILLILYTGKNPLGIPNNKLLSILWNSKEEDAAKNTRNVYMSRLRNLLAQVGDVKILTHNGFRNISFGPGTMCDYLEALRLFGDIEGENLDRLLELLFNGVMLPNVEFDYVDSFKSNFSNQTLDLLSILIQQADTSNSLKLRIADTLFQHDFINEDALRVKCIILHSQGRTGVAQAVYKSFCKEYRSIMGSDYPHSLTDLINGDARGNQ